MDNGSVTLLFQVKLTAPADGSMPPRPSVEKGDRCLLKESWQSGTHNNIGVSFC
jgi:hypothetical protein